MTLEWRQTPNYRFSLPDFLCLTHGNDVFPRRGLWIGGE